MKTVGCTWTKPNSIFERYFNKLCCLTMVLASCNFPAFLLIQTTNTWWSGTLRFDYPSTFSTRSLDNTYSPQAGISFPQLIVRKDLRKLVITLPGISEDNIQITSSDRSFSEYIQSSINGKSTSIPITLRCDRIVDSENLIYITELLMPNARSKYVCIRFNTLDESAPHEVFELFQGFIQNQTNGHCAQEDLNMHRSIWIPSIIKYTKEKKTICPFAGGFQAKTFVNIDNHKPICQSSVYVTIDAECIKGEGIEFHFNEPLCNPFESSLVSQLSCFAVWSEKAETFTILVKRISLKEFVMVTMLYQEAPKAVNLGLNAYANFTSVYLGLGLLRPSPSSLSAQPFPNYLQHLSLVTHENKPTNIIYEIKIRGAFGVCDDELELCEKGCNADAKNRLFCRRSCRSVRKECNVALRDTCEINPSYRGLWVLINASKGEVHFTPSLGNEEVMNKYITISDRTVSFTNTIGDGTFYEFNCHREAGEIVPDWYILGSRQLQPGCHPRDICLEVYQSRPLFSNEGPNKNTLQYKISKSQRQGVDISTLCTFPKQTIGSLDQTFQTNRAQILIKQARDTVGRLVWNDSGSDTKCELYQIKLQGIINISLQRLDTFLASKKMKNENSRRSLGSWNTSPPLRSSDISDESGLKNKYFYGYDTWDRQMNDDTQYNNGNIHCPIELSDFNPNLGTTGEFDGLLRMKLACSKISFSKYLNSAQKCISVFNIDKGFKYSNRYIMLITYSDATESFFCWIIRESEVDRKKSFVMHIFASPQCQYEETSLGEIVVDNRTAVAVLRVVSDKGPCPHCGPNRLSISNSRPHTQQFKQIPRKVSMIMPTTSDCRHVSINVAFISAFISALQIP